MELRILEDGTTLGAAAAAHAATALRGAIARQGHVRVVAATAASQMPFLAALTAAPGIDWTRVELFHLDEYIGLPMTHRASFRRLLREHLVDKTGIATWHPLDGDGDEAEVRRRVGAALQAAPIDIAFVGIGENAHLAFNDPPADFDTTEPYLVVQLDEACRRQQVGEGWFPALEAVPRTAISMSIRQILKAREILVIVPDARKAEAVQAMMEAPITPAVPASILRTHPNVTVYLDRASASRL
jgi:glucosamine-6-phosphate deaminase